MPPEVSAFRSASPEGMEEVLSADEAKLKGRDRNGSLAFKDPAQKPEVPEKERQMIGRADQVYGLQTCFAVDSANGTVHVQMEQVRHSSLISELRVLMGCNDRQKRRFEYIQRKPSKARKYKFTKYVILVRRRISSKGMPTGVEEVDIRGPLLQQALAEIHSETEGFSFDQDPPQVTHYVHKWVRKSLR